MANTDSDPEDDGENIEDVDFDADDVEDEIDEDILDAIEAGAEEASDGDQDSEEDDSDDGSDDDDEDEEAPAASQASALPAGQATTTPAKPPPATKAPTPPSRAPSLSPALARRALLRPAVPFPKSYTVEAICALPHPVPTHSLAATPCMLHLLTGSDDGYVRDYDIFSAVNSKVFLTAPQRHHAGVVEGILKAGQIRSWWENPGARSNVGDLELAPVHSLAIHGDALWGLAGSNAGNINLYTIRHEPGRIFHTMEAHRGPVSALCLQHDENGFFSAGWDGNALQWDLNTGQIVRRFRTHGAQVAALQVRPLTSTYPTTPSPYHLSMSGSVQPTSQETAPLNEMAQPDTSYSATQETAFTATSTTLSNPSDAPAQSTQNPSESTIAPATQATDADAKSDTSYDPLFDDEPDAEGEPDTSPPSPSGQQSTQASTTGPTTASGPMLHLPTPASFGSTPAPKTVSAAAPAPKNAPPVLDHTSFAAFSPDIMMTAYMDGQVILWDCRVADPTPGRGVGRLWMSEKTPPWCLSACWAMNGAQIYAGRRNGTIDIWDVRQLGRSGPSETPRLWKTLRNPISSGVVSCVAAFPDGRHIACASNDNIRLWNAAEAGEGDVKGRVQFKIIPGHHGGIISQMLIDPAARFLVSASGNRGWHGDATRTVFVHDIKPIE